MKTNVQIALATMEASTLPPLTSILITNNEFLKNIQYFESVMIAIVAEAIKGLEQLLTQHKITSKKDYNVAYISGSIIIGRTLNNAFEPDYPNILVLLQQKIGDKHKLMLKPILRNIVPGIHDCLRSDILPILTVEEVIDEANQKVTYKILETIIFPEIKNQEFEEPENPPKK